MVKRQEALLITGNVQGSSDYRIAINSKFGHFLVFHAGDLDGSGYPKRGAEFHEISYSEVMMAVKNSLLLFQKGIVTFENQDQTEVWQLILSPRQ